MRRLANRCKIRPTRVPKQHQGNLCSCAGSIGGVAEACCLQPIDVIKTRLQLDHVSKYKGAALVYACMSQNDPCASDASPKESVASALAQTGIWHCGETVIKEEGVRALWKGLTPFAVHLTLKYALRMGTNALYQSLLRDEVITHAPALPHSIHQSQPDVGPCCT